MNQELMMIKEGKTKMSEGKLKTEINKLLDKGAAMQYSSLQCNNSAEVAGVLSVGIKPSVNQILDEATKKYHFGMPIIILSENPTKEQIREAFELLRKTLNDKDEWFLENFGYPANGYPSEVQLKRLHEKEGERANDDS